jgi:hypothetical protein
MKLVIVSFYSLGIVLKVFGRITIFYRQEVIFSENNFSVGLPSKIQIYVDHAYKNHSTGFYMFFLTTVSHFLIDN